MTGVTLTLQGSANIECKKKTEIERGRKKGRARRGRMSRRGDHEEERGGHINTSGIKASRVSSEVTQSLHREKWGNLMVKLVGQRTV